jgi:hypothetical protein
VSLVTQDTLSRPAGYVSRPMLLKRRNISRRGIGQGFKGPTRAIARSTPFPISTSYLGRFYFTYTSMTTFNAV